MNRLITILDSIGIPFAYDHFAEGESPAPPFICYLTPQSDNFAADGMVYHKITGVSIELYTDAKSPETEKKPEDALASHRIFYNKSEVWIDSEKLYEVLYQFDTLPIIKNTNRILVLDHGRITETGTHDQLVNNGGKYAAMWAASLTLK